MCFIHILIMPYCDDRCLKNIMNMYLFVESSLKVLECQSLTKDRTLYDAPKVIKRAIFSLNYVQFQL